jgi:hypothetical protein
VCGTFETASTELTEGDEMYVRVARFEGADPSRIDQDYEQFREMIKLRERPEFMSEDVFETLRGGVRRVMSLADRESGVTLDLTFTDNAEDAHAVHQALDSLSPPEGSGRRVDVQTYELMVDEQL